MRPVFFSAFSADFLRALCGQKGPQPAAEPKGIDKTSGISILARPYPNPRLSGTIIEEEQEPFRSQLSADGSHGYQGRVLSQ
jgi:hypothetical protein